VNEANTQIFLAKWPLAQANAGQVNPHLTYQVALAARDQVALDMHDLDDTYNASLLRGDATVLAAQAGGNPVLGQFPTEAPTLQVQCSQYRGK
jgi:hypothetical protein